MAGANASGGATSCSSDPINVGSVSKLGGGVGALVPDAEGWTVVWMRVPILSVANENGGIFAARVGTDRVLRLADWDSSGEIIAGVETSLGTLLCWSPSWSATPARTCAVFDSALFMVGQPRSLTGSIQALARMGSALYGISAGYSSSPTLTPLDEGGTPIGPAVALPCLPTAWNSERLACLVPSSPDCGTQRAPADCELRFRSITPTGEVASADVAIAPIAWQTNYDVKVLEFPFLAAA